MIKQFMLNKINCLRVGCWYGMRDEGNEWEGKGGD